MLEWIRVKYLDGKVKEFKEGELSGDGKLESISLNEDRGTINLIYRNVDGLIEDVIFMRNIAGYMVPK